MAVLGELVIARLTELGDADQYQRSVFTVLELTQIFSIGEVFYIGRVYSTALTESLGALFHILLFGNSILIDIAFQTIAFVGIFKFLVAVDATTRRYLAILILTPSFNLWSSIAAKEALIVLFVGVLGAYLIRLYQNRPRIGLLEIICAIGIFIFKVHYLPALLAMYLIIVVGQRVRQKAMLAIGVSLFSLVPLYYFRDKIDAMAFNIAPHFLGYGSSREMYWIQQYDVFFKAPYGMFQGFFGPTIQESLAGPLQMASFLESAFIVGVLVTVLLLNIKNLPVFSFFVGLSSLFWLLFASYPLGILNAGTAVRYRTGHILLVILIFAIILSRERYILWLERSARRDPSVKGGPPLTAGT